MLNDFYIRQLNQKLQEEDDETDSRNRSQLHTIGAKWENTSHDVVSRQVRKHNEYVEREFANVT